MTGKEFKVARKQRHWTQCGAAHRLGVSQAYVALLEQGQRQFPPALARKAVRLLNMSPSALPLCRTSHADADMLTRQLSALGYPGFAHVRPSHRKNPAEVLLAALGNDNLEARVSEALPWLLLQYGMTDVCKQWLVEQARLCGLTNRLGFVVTLAKQVAEKKGETTSQAYVALDQLERELYQTRLAEQNTFCQAQLTTREREWLEQVRPEAARQWNLLTNWRPEYLQYA